MRYLDQDTADLCRDALRQGLSLDDLAGRHVDTELLGRLLQLPACGPVPAADPELSVDLWAADRLDGQL